MRQFANLSVQVKIGVIVGIGVCVALVIGILGLHAVTGAAAAAHRIYTGNLSSTAVLGMLSTTVTQARLSLANQILSGDQATTAKYTEAFDNDARAVDEALAAYEASGPAGAASTIAALEGSWAKYVDIARASRSRPASARTWWPGRPPGTGRSRRCSTRSSRTSTSCGPRSTPTRPPRTPGRQRSTTRTGTRPSCCWPVGRWSPRVSARSSRAASSARCAGSSRCATSWRPATSPAAAD